ncbi:doublesex and mab-3 related transcription factor 3, truncated-like [Salvia splendens]|uniref:doublesex and mab-3 related transcription factor 3, truncated-like n=1 Tax=Salvia splendens TaxID=180675 RepID=UPI001C263304|nr:doublesex and mab-3 related transcription factor 3, truncated-like [Salvia splendens]
MVIERANSSTQSGKPPPSFRSALHTVRKPTKKPIAPPPPAPPRIYKVAPVELKDVVQKLTGSVEVQPTRLLREVAPPPLSLHPPHHSENEEKKSQKSTDGCFGILSPLGFSISLFGYASQSRNTCFLRP